MIVTFNKITNKIDKDKSKIILDIGNTNTKATAKIANNIPNVELSTSTVKYLNPKSQ